MAPFGSDYSAGGGANACRSLQRGPGRFCCVAVPASDGGGGTGALLLLRPGSVSYLSDRALRPRCLAIFLHLPGNACDPSNRAMLQTPAWRRRCVEPGDYTALSTSIRLRQSAGRRVCVALGQADFPVGCSAAGRLFKGKLWAKKERENDELCGCHGNGPPRGTGCLLEHAPAHNKHTCVNCTPISRGRCLLRAWLLARLLDFLSFFFFSSSFCSKCALFKISGPDLFLLGRWMLSSGSSIHCLATLS